MLPGYINGSVISCGIRGSGEEIEHHLYRTDNGMFKRFFDEEDIKTIFSGFNIFFCEEQKMMRYKREKIVYCVALLNKK